MYILVRVIALLFHCVLCLARMRSEPSLWSLAENLKSTAHALLTAKWTYIHGFRTFTDGEYTCEIYVMHSGKEHTAQTARSLSVRAALNSNYRLYILPVSYSPSDKACHVFRTKCLMHIDWVKLGLSTKMTNWLVIKLQNYKTTHYKITQINKKLQI